MNDLLNRLGVSADQLKSVAPALIAAALILLTGYLLARQVQRWTGDLLQRWNFGKLMGSRSGPSGIDSVGSMARLLFWLVMLIVMLLSSTALGFETVGQIAELLISYFPTLLGAAITVILGVIAGEFIRAVILASAGSAEGAPTVARLAKSAVVLVSVFMALQQLGVGEDIVTATFTLVFGSIALAAGLAFGLGNRELAGEITRRWFERGRTRSAAAAENAPAEEELPSPPNE
jgi:hypothetical protein